MILSETRNIPQCSKQALHICERSTHSTGTVGAMPPRRTNLSLEDLASGQFSPFTVQEAIGQHAPYAVVAVDGVSEAPTILAISGGEQVRISAFFLAWQADTTRGCQVVVPLRKKLGTEYLFEGGGADGVESIARSLLDGTLPSASAVMGGRLHLVGYSNGSTSVLELARRLPGRVASLTLLAGIERPCMVDVESLRRVPRITMFVGQADGHCQPMVDLKARLNSAGIAARLHVLNDAHHEDLGRKVPMEEFWEGLPLSTAEAAEAAEEEAAAAAEEAAAEAEDALGGYTVGSRPSEAEEVAELKQMFSSPSKGALPSNRRPAWDSTTPAEPASGAGRPQGGGEGNKRTGS